MSGEVQYEFETRGVRCDDCDGVVVSADDRESFNRFFERHCAHRGFVQLAVIVSPEGIQNGPLLEMRLNWDPLIPDEKNNLHTFRFMI